MPVDVDTPKGENRSIKINHLHVGFGAGEGGKGKVRAGSPLRQSQFQLVRLSVAAAIATAITTIIRVAAVACFMALCVLCVAALSFLSFSFFLRGREETRTDTNRHESEQESAARAWLPRQQSLRRLCD
jgi:hypothetical protein